MTAATTQWKQDIAEMAILAAGPLDGLLGG